MAKKKIIHVIDDLGRGGAETLLVDLLPDISATYELILVTLGDTLQFDPQEIVCSQRYSLGYNGIKDLLPAARKLRKLILQHRPDLVRSQLYWSTIVTRLACPKNVPLFFSYHATLNEDPIAFYKRRFLYWLEKATYRRRQRMIGVTQAVIDSFKQVHPRHGQTFLLHNFVRNAFFQQAYRVNYNGNRPLRLVAVSNIRLIKNIPYLVDAMNLLPQDKVVLHIYGDGPLRAEVESRIKKYALKNVELKGRRADIHNVLLGYDVFLSPSTVEGFGIAVAEAMSLGLPVIISDIPVYREIGADKALYLNNRDPHSLKTLLLEMINGKVDLQKLGNDNKSYAEKMFSKAGYVTKLNEIYNATVFER